MVRAALPARHISTRGRVRGEVGETAMTNLEDPRPDAMVRNTKVYERGRGARVGWRRVNQAQLSLRWPSSLSSRLLTFRLASGFLHEGLTDGE